MTDHNSPPLNHRNQMGNSNFRGSNFRRHSFSAPRVDHRAPHRWNSHNNLNFPNNNAYHQQTPFNSYNQQSQIPPNFNQREPFNDFPNHQQSHYPYNFKQYRGNNSSRGRGNYRSSSSNNQQHNYNNGNKFPNNDSQGNSNQKSDNNAPSLNS